MSAHGARVATHDATPMTHGPSLGRYRLAHPIASGGAATVYLARASFAPGVSRAVAVKCLHPHLARRRDDVAMFLDEASVACRITHPNVCAVLDVGQVDGTWLIAMEHLAGVSLAELAAAAAQRPELTRTRAWPVLVAQMVADACEGLHAAHELRDESGRLLDVVHRDATPQNVMVTWDGVVKVVDFGIAVARGRVPRTEAGMLRGKVSFVSPEQMRGQPLDRRSDVWTMAVGLWELLALRRLFARRSDTETFDAILTHPIAAPSTHAPMVPPGLDAIVLAALQRDPAARTPSARALATSLRAFVAVSGVSSTTADVVMLLDALFPGRRAQARATEARALGARTERPAAPTGSAALGAPSPFAPVSDVSAPEVSGFRAIPTGDAIERMLAELATLAERARAYVRQSTDAPLAPGETAFRWIAWALAAVLVVLALSLGARSLARASMRAVALDAPAVTVSVHAAGDAPSAAADR